jgi:hypothetical protein
MKELYAIKQMLLKSFTYGKNQKCGCSHKKYVYQSVIKNPVSKQAPIAPALPDFSRNQLVFPYVFIYYIFRFLYKRIVHKSPPQTILLVCGER